MKKTLNELYKKNSTGKIQFWKIRVRQGVQALPELVTNYGVLGGKEQETSEVIEGKNIGKKNETSDLEQAILEAKARWTKKKKSGYVETFTGAKDGEVDKVIEGGINPMLAQAYDKAIGKVSYPCIVQPKLDGIRCIIIKKGQDVSLWTRTRKRINSCPHIEDEVRELVAGDLILDGELYNHDFRDNFEAIVSAVRKEEPSKESSLVQFHAYDLVTEADQEERIRSLFTLPFNKRTNKVKLVTTLLCKTEESMKSCVKSFVESDGYEGGIIRNLKAKYENKRSMNLVKVKEFQDAEFKIVGIEEGKGKLAGHVGAFVCTTKSGEKFKAKMVGELSHLKTLYENEKLWKGKSLTVQYQGLTGKNKVPRFPVGLRIRADL